MVYWCILEPFLSGAIGILELLKELGKGVVTVTLQRFVPDWGKSLSRSPATGLFCCVCVELLK